MQNESVKKDKTKVIDETLSDEKVRRFLLLEPTSGEKRDFNILLKAYRGLNEADFQRFINFFKEEGLDINAKNREGKTIFQLIKGHTKSHGYRNTLKSAGCEQ